MKLCWIKILNLRRFRGIQLCSGRSHSLTVERNEKSARAFDCVVWHLIYSHQLVEPISHLSQMLQIWLKVRQFSVQNQFFESHAGAQKRQPNSAIHRAHNETQKKQREKCSFHFPETIHRAINPSIKPLLSFLLNFFSFSHSSKREEALNLEERDENGLEPNADRGSYRWSSISR